VEALGKEAFAGSRGEAVRRARVRAGALASEKLASALREKFGAP